MHRVVDRGQRWAAPLAAVLAASATFCTTAAHAQSSWNFRPSIGGELVYTTNVDLGPSESRESDFIFTITPGFSVDYAGPRAVLRGSVSLPISLYARTGDRNNELHPSGNLFGSVELVKDFFLVEAEAIVSQTYFNPFGARPDNVTNETENRYTSQSYRVSPVIQGFIGSDITYSLRNDNLWTQLDNSPVGDRQVYTNRLLGTINRSPTPLGWGADVQRTQYRFPEQAQTQILELVRLRAVHAPDPQLQVYATVGYERNRFPLAETDGAIYGAGVSWRPTERTSLDANWEERFFGPSYSFAFNHRTPRTVWTVLASRNITSYPELIANLPTGTFIPGLLNDLLASRIPDPVERARYIIQFVTDRGLPVFLSDPLSIYTQQIYLKEQAGVTAGLVGARNSVFFATYYAKTEAITAAGDLLPPVLGSFLNNEEVGGSVVWTYQLTSATSLSVSGTASATKSIGEVRDGRSDRWALRAYLTRPVSPRTTVFAGARYQTLESNVGPGYNEAAVFVGANHRFR